MNGAAHPNTPLPDDLIAKIPALPTKHRIEDKLEIVRSGRVAVEVEAAGGLQHAVDFDDPERHVDEVGEQAAAPEHLLQPADQLDRLLGPARLPGARVQPLDVEDIIDPLVGLVFPRPGIDERLRLGAILAALVVVDLEIIALRVERRVDVAKIDAAALDLTPQHLEVVAVVQLVGHAPSRRAGTG